MQLQRVAIMIHNPDTPRARILRSTLRNWRAQFVMANLVTVEMNAARWRTLAQEGYRAGIDYAVLESEPLPPAIASTAPADRQAIRPRPRRMGRMMPR